MGRDVAAARPWSWIQRLGRLRQIGNSDVLGVQYTRLGNQYLGDVGEDSPLTALIGVSQRGTADDATNAQVEVFRQNSVPARFDVA